MTALSAARPTWRLSVSAAPRQAVAQTIASAHSTHPSRRPCDVVLCADASPELTRGPGAAGRRRRRESALARAGRRNSEASVPSAVRFGHRGVVPQRHAMDAVPETAENPSPRTAPSAGRARAWHQTGAGRKAHRQSAESADADRHAGSRVVRASSQRASSPLREARRSRHGAERSRTAPPRHLTEGERSVEGRSDRPRRWAAAQNPLRL
jgi:hypothetical protein